MAIKGFTGTTRLPRLGKIRLGMKVQKGDKTFPKALDYFLVPPEVLEAYTPEGSTEPVKLKRLDVMAPSEDLETFFPVALKRYNGSGALLCRGDGEAAMELAPVARPDHFKTQGFSGDQRMLQRECPYRDCSYYREGKCQEIGTLNVMLPKVRGLGTYQISTTSYNSVTNIMNGFELLRQMIGQIAFVPVTLEVRMEQVLAPGSGGNKIKSIVPIMYITLPGTVDDLLELARSRKLVKAVQVQLENPSADDEMPELLYPVLMNGDGERPAGELPTEESPNPEAASEPVTEPAPADRAPAETEPEQAPEQAKPETNDLTEWLNKCMEVLGWLPGQKRAALEIPKDSRTGLIKRIEADAQKQGKALPDRSSATPAQPAPVQAEAPKMAPPKLAKAPEPKVEAPKPMQGTGAETPSVPPVIHQQPKPPTVQRSFF